MFPAQIDPLIEEQTLDCNGASFVNDNDEVVTLFVFPFGFLEPGRNYSGFLTVTADLHSEIIAFENSTKSKPVELVTSNVLPNLTTILTFSVSGFGLGIRYQVDDHGGQEVFADTIEFANFFDVSLDKDYIGFLLRIWVLNAQNSDEVRLTIGVGSILSHSITEDTTTSVQISLTFEGNVDLVTFKGPLEQKMKTNERKGLCLDCNKGEANILLLLITLPRQLPSWK